MASVLQRIKGKRVKAQGVPKETLSIFPESMASALVADVKKGLSLEVLREAEIPEGSPLRLYRGKRLHYLIRDKAGKLKVINPELQIIYGETPADLYEALTCSDVEIVYQAEPTSWYKGANMPYLIVIGIGLFLLFMLWGTGGLK